MAHGKEYPSDKWQDENEYIRGLLDDNKFAPALKNVLTRKIDHFSTRQLQPDRGMSIEFASGAIHGLVSLYKDLFRYVSHGRNLLAHAEEKVLEEAAHRRSFPIDGASAVGSEPQPYRRDLG